MTLVLNYKFDQADLTIDSSTSGISLINTGGVVSAVDATYGNVASFNASNNSYFSSGTSLSQLQGASSRTVCYWVNRNTKSNFGIPWSYGNTSSTGGGTRSAFGTNGLLYVAYGGSGSQIPTATSLSAGTWYHVAEIYDGTTLSIHINGVFSNSVDVAFNATSDPIAIGKDVVNVTSNNFIFTGYLSDFRVYDDSLSSTDLLELYTNGPNADLSSLEVTMYTHVADLTWTEVDGASTYYVTFIEDSLDEDELTTTSTTTFEAFDLTPGVPYVFNVYTDLDIMTPVYTFAQDAVDLNSTNVSLLLTRLGNDLTLINEASLDQIDAFLNTVLVNGEVVTTLLGEAIFAESSGTLVLSDKNESVLTPFQVSSGSGQNISIVMPDSTSITVSYDETTNNVVSDSVNHPVGTTFVAGGLKVYVKEI